MKLYYGILFTAQMIRNCDNFDFAYALFFEGARAVRNALIEDRITYTMRSFLMRKLIAALVEGGFKSSRYSREFGSKESRRYTRIYY